MMNLEIYFSKLILRELEQFRDGTPKPAEDIATKVAKHDPPPPSAKGQDSTAVQTANTKATINAAKDKQQATTQQPQDTIVLGHVEEAAPDLEGTPVKLITIRSTTDRQRKNNGARFQRVYRLAQKIGVSPGGPRWIRDGKPYMQPAIPQATTRADGTIEYNQFMYDDAGKVVLRMPGGWKRDLVRNRPQFLGVAVIDGYLWPRFSPNLPRRMTVDWGKSSFLSTSPGLMP